MSASLAVLDIGSNSVRFAFMDRGSDGAFFGPDGRKEICTTRLGKGLDKTGCLAPGPMAATIQAIHTAMLEGNAAYANALSVNNGWSFYLMIATLTVMKDYNGYMILPILSALTQVIMTKLTSNQQNPAQNAANDQAAATSKMMTWFFPLFSLFICFNYSSAFALYWVMGNITMMVQTIVINRMLDKRDEKAKLAGEGTVK